MTARVERRPVVLAEQLGECFDTAQRDAQVVRRGRAESLQLVDPFFELLIEPADLGLGLLELSSLYDLQVSRRTATAI